MASRLTEQGINRFIREAREANQRRDLSDPELPGLKLRVAASTTTWSLQLRDRDGRVRRFLVGAWPQTGIARAREDARALRVRVWDGGDPVHEARQRRQEARAGKGKISSLRALLDLYAEQRGHALRTWAEQRKRLDHLFRPFLDTPLARLTLGELQLHADRHRARHYASTCVRYLRPIMKWASAAGRSYVDPALGLLSSPAVAKRRLRTLSPAELRDLLPVMRKSTRPQARAMHFMLLTLCRRDEAASAKWQDVDWTAATWTIPRPKKTKPTDPDQPRVVPLSRQALDLLRGLPAGPSDDLIFRTPPSSVRATGPAGAKASARTPTPKLSRWHSHTVELQRQSGTSGWTRHDLRRTGATLLGELGHPPHVVEAALGHTDAAGGRLGANYNRARYLQEVRAAVQALADQLDVLGAGNVIPLPRATAAA